MNEDNAVLRQLIGRLRFRHLRLLVVLHETGTLHGAAARMSVTQSALSKALTEIESVFGTPLFERHARGLTATEAGLQAIRGAALLLRELAHVTEQVVADPPSTVLRLGVIPAEAQHSIPDLLHRLIHGETAVPLRVALQEGRTDWLLQGLLKGELDAVITPLPMELPEQVTTQLRHVVLHDAALIIIAPEGHPLERRNVVEWKQLLTAPWILPAENSMVRRLLNNAFLNAGLPPPTVLIESANPYTNLQLVARGLGLSAIPEAALISVETGLRGKPPVRQLKMRPQRPSGKVVMFYRKHSENYAVSCILEALGVSTMEDVAGA